MKEDGDPDPITALPKSSDDEAENSPIEKATGNDSYDSDEDYSRRHTGDIRGTTFGKDISSTGTSTRSSKPKIRVPQPYGSKIDSSSSFTRSKRSTEEDWPEEVNQVDRKLEALPQKKKKQPVIKYGSQQNNRRRNVSQSIFPSSKDHPTSSGSQDSALLMSGNKSFHRVQSISPTKSQSPRKQFKAERQTSDFEEPETSKPRFKNIPRHDSSPLSTPGKRRLRHMSPVDESTDNQKPELANLATKGVGNKTATNRPVRRKGPKRRKPASGLIAEEVSERPVFKIPGLEDIDSFDDSGSLDATATPEESQDTSRDYIEAEEVESTTTPTCPMCHQEVDRELLERHSSRGKMNVKQQTAFCRLHKRLSAAKAGTEKGYPNIDWETLQSRCSAHQGFLQDILEGIQASHYRKVLKDKVDSGKNRTLLKSHDNLTPGYYGPRGLQAMTEFIMGTLSDVIRRRAVEDKLISARTYTGYVQTVLVPELTVRLIMEDMSVTEERARDVLEESVEIGELLHEEARDVVKIDRREEDISLDA
ncbi:hypothetical protein NUW58_g7416 [Xylaria curta]|uniref:Uncharacterized protein n=1 Tax=Xylaria curta TaxID=42375 RepID=A0ACC1NH81_9PEZI|nr:hypothetical protein NUW58_g7416 [Xylaria curta]